MQNSPGSHQTSNSTAAKLLEVDSELASLEVELLSQLESIQEKRRSLKTVIGLFTESVTQKTAPTLAPQKTPEAKTDEEPLAVGENVFTQSLSTPSTTATVDVETEALPDTQPNVTKRKAPSLTKGGKTQPATRLDKTTKKAAEWQDYMRKEFSSTSLAEVVHTVLQRHADEVLEISAIMNAIFSDDLPKDVGSQARRQVTNILSQGAMKNKWYRGQLGQYSMSKAAAKANS